MCGGDGEVGVGAHNQRYVPVPGVVAADLVMIEPDLVLRGLEALFDRPSGARDPDQFLITGLVGP